VSWADVREARALRKDGMELLHGNPALRLERERASRGVSGDDQWSAIRVNHAFLVKQILNPSQALEHGDEGGRSLDEKKERIQGDTEEGQRGE